MYEHLLPKPNKYKATFKLVAADKETEPWTADRYAEIDFCLAHRRWANSINNVYIDPYTSVHTYHKSVIVKLNQKQRGRLKDFTCRGTKKMISISSSNHNRKNTT